MSYRSGLYRNLSSRTVSVTKNRPGSIRVRLKTTLIEIANGSHDLEQRLEATRQLVDLLMAETPKMRKRKTARQAAANVLGIRN
jgi:hypothetical protein